MKLTQLKRANVMLALFVCALCVTIGKPATANGLGGMENIMGGGGFGSLVGNAQSSLGSMTNGMLNGPLNMVNQAMPNLLNGVKPMMGSVGNMLNGPSGGLAGAMGMGGMGRLTGSLNKPLGEGVKGTVGFLDGIATAGAGAAGLGNVGNSLHGASSSIIDAAEGLQSSLTGPQLGTGMSGPFDGFNLKKREAIASGIAGAEAAGAAVAAGAPGLAGAAAAAAGAGMEMGAANTLGHGAFGAGVEMAANAVTNGIEATNAVANSALAAHHVANTAAVEKGALAATKVIANRQGMAVDALKNAQAETAIAGADMAAHGANNARSASLAINAYRQAKLAGARDRVNIAGTIQNSARISDAAIATHDSATRAEDSLLGSELAVDSAGTVLDSDASYIPPVTSSLLRSLPYGRLGIRNIVPKPLTYPSVLLPDVWLNGRPVNYFNLPLRALPYGIGAPETLYQSGLALANGQLINGQPFRANNGFPLNSLAFDPRMNGYMSDALASSVYPILMNGQLEAHDEVALANAIRIQQQHGPGMAATYGGFGLTNPVPMLTGTVTDVNLQPTTNIGTTYPIGSALVIEPRDSFFQDYVDNASSRQNFDERHQ